MRAATLARPKEQSTCRDRTDERFGTAKTRIFRPPPVRRPDAMITSMARGDYFANRRRSIESKSVGLAIWMHFFRFVVDPTFVLVGKRPLQSDRARLDVNYAKLPHQAKPDRSGCRHRCSRRRPTRANRGLIAAIDVPHRQRPKVVVAPEREGNAGSVVPRDRGPPGRRAAARTRISDQCRRSETKR